MKMIGSLDFIPEIFELLNVQLASVTLPPDSIGLIKFSAISKNKYGIVTTRFKDSEPN